MESRNGRVRAQVKLMEGVREDTVWTWNAIGKQRGAWNLAEDANESRQGFLMNHIIGDQLPENGGPAYANADPVTGQAAWFDLRVNIYPATDNAETTWPLYTDNRAAGADGDRVTHVHLPADLAPPEDGCQVGGPAARLLRYSTHKAVNLRRSARDILTR